jgi:hypothetical protein
MLSLQEGPGPLLDSDAEYDYFAEDKGKPAQKKKSWSKVDGERQTILLMGRGGHGEDYFFSFASLRSSKITQ